MVMKLKVRFNLWGTFEPHQRTGVVLEGGNHAQKFFTRIFLEQEITLRFFYSSNFFPTRIFFSPENFSSTLSINFDPMFINAPEDPNGAVRGQKSDW